MMSQRMNARARLGGLALLAAPLVAGCGDDLYDAREVKSFSEGATFHIAEDGVIAYTKDIKAKLRPDFRLAGSAKGPDGKPIVTSQGDAALAKVRPTTGYYEQQIVRALTAALALSLPTTTTSNEITSKSEDGGTPKVTINNSTTFQSGKPVTPEQLRQQLGERPEVSVSPLTTAPDSARPLEQMDPILQYQLATALVQEVTMLNEVLDSIDRLADATHDTYIVRMRLAVQPIAPNQPYNAQVSMGFFCAQQGVSQSPPIKVHPLLVSDSLEATSTARTAQLITQLSLAISGMIGSVGIGGLFNSDTNKIRTLLGKDLTSTLSVSRTSDNTVNVRLGAPRQPTAGYAMINRNHTVSVVAQVPKACDAVNVAAAASLREATTGQQVPDPVEPLIENLRAGFRRYLESYLDDRAAVDRAMQNVGRRDLVALAEFVRPAREKDFVERLQAILKNILASIPAQTTAVEDAAGGWRNLWVVFSGKLSHSPYQNASVQLPKKAGSSSPTVPPPPPVTVPLSRPAMLRAL